MKSVKQVLIIGCGWLGKPLGKTLSDAGYRVFGTTRDQDKLKDLKQYDIEPIVLDLMQQSDAMEQLPKVDFTILTVPPSGISSVEHELHSVLKQLLQMPRLGQFIYTSSTSVYPNTNGEVNESDAEEIYSPHSGKSVLRIENELRKYQPNFNILRFGGLFGNGRNPVTRLAKKSELSKAEDPVNMTHLQDAIKSIETLLLKEVKSETFNAVSPEHPTKLQFYRAAAEKEGVNLPNAANEPKSDYKIVSSQKIIEQLNYTFTYQNPIEAL